MIPNWDNYKFCNTPMKPHDMKSQNLVGSLVRELESSLAKLSPAILPGFRPPATPIQIDAAEREVGLKFPSELRDFLACQNGQHSYSKDLGYSDPVIPAMRLQSGLSSHLWFAGLDEIIENTRQLREDYHQYWKDEEFTTVGPVRNHENFIVFTTTENADWLVLDLEPAIGGKLGQVVMQCTQPCELIVVADGLENFLRLICDGYDTNRFKFHSNDYFTLYTDD